MENSPFGKLSPELRNRIHGYALIFEDTPLHVTADHYNSKLRTTKECAALQPLALTTVCRQIREETVQMFYHYNTFNIHFETSTEDRDRDEACLLQRFTANMGGVNATNLRRIAVTIGRDNFMAEVPDRVDDILHQLLMLRTFALSNPTCEVLCDFSWTGFTDLEPMEREQTDIILFPNVQFRVEAGTANLSKAIIQLEKMIEGFGGIFVDHCVDLVELLKNLVTDQSPEEGSCYYEREDYAHM